MSYANYLRELLRPLGVYDLNAPFNGGELDAAGAALDAVEGALDELHREADLTTAESWGLDLRSRLFVRKPVAGDAAGMRKALAALLRIGGDSFTLDAINDTLSGCGVHAVAEEQGVGSVLVSFPDQPGIPEGFEQMRKIIEDVLPAHVGIEYWFWYRTWEELEGFFHIWKEIEDKTLTWKEMETYSL